MIKNKVNSFINSNKLFIFLVGSYLAKTILAYYVEFDLGISSFLQFLIAILSILSISFLIYGIGFFLKNEKIAKIVLILMNLLLTTLLISNIFYYREFSDFLSVDTIFKASNASKGIVGSVFNMLKFYDILYFLDTIILTFLLFTPRINRESLSIKQSFVKIPMGVLMCGITLGLASYDRPQLLTRSFDNNYLVKYLGLSGFTLKNYSDYKAMNTLRAGATENDLILVENYITQTSVVNKNQYTGIAKDKNVIYVHLESMHEFILGMTLPDKEGKPHEITPFLNSMYSSKDSLPFDNAFHQVRQGKTSDAEFMIENSLFGSSGGSAMVKFGTDNTFYSAPHIFKKEGYTTQVFHGNVHTFWNRNNAYKSFGYDKFYSLKDFENQEVVNYGLKDEVFFQESFEKLQSIEGKKYSKLIPVSNHFPYDIDSLEFEVPFELPDTSDDSVNNYFFTMNYMDSQIEKFYNNLKEAGELDNTIFVFYSDHFGISNSRTEALSEVLGYPTKKESEEMIEKGEIPEKWTGFNNAMIQKIPLIFHIPESNVNPNKEASKKFVGQIDVLPTLLNLMGIDYSDRMFLGQDMLGNFNDNVVEFRDSSFVSEKYTLYKNKLYDTHTGELILQESLSEEEKEEVLQIKENVTKKLEMSDKVLNQNLLQFRYHKEDITDKSKYPY